MKKLISRYSPPFAASLGLACAKKHLLDTFPYERSHVVWPVRRNCNAGHLRAGKKERLVYPCVWRFLRHGLCLRISARRMAFRDGTYWMGHSGCAAMVAGEARGVLAGRQSEYSTPLPVASWTSPLADCYFLPIGPLLRRFWMNPRLPLLDGPMIHLLRFVPERLASRRRPRRLSRQIQ